MGSIAKKALIVLMVAFISGCASHAEIKMPVVKAISIPDLEDKNIYYEIYYSQPKPGVLSGGEQAPLKPIEESELSITSSAVLKDLPNYLMQQLPVSARLSDKSNSDYTISVELVANHKRGPAYANHEFAKSLGKGLLTLGLAWISHSTSASTALRL